MTTPNPPSLLDAARAALAYMDDSAGFWERGFNRDDISEPLRAAIAREEASYRVHCPNPRPHRGSGRRIRC